MDIKTMDPDYAAMAQISVADVAVLYERGFRSIVCHRPDHEAPGQPEFAVIAQTATELGMGAVHLPVVPNGITEDDVLMFSEALKDLEVPVLGYCGSGMRAMTLWTALQTTE